MLTWKMTLWLVAATLGALMGVFDKHYKLKSYLLQAVGEFLLQCARVENEVWLVAEAVDALMDVFAEDHLNMIVQELGLIQKLSALAPQIKTKVTAYGVVLNLRVCVLCCLLIPCVSIRISVSCMTTLSYVCKSPNQASGHTQSLLSAW